MNFIFQFNRILEKVKINQIELGKEEFKKYEMFLKYFKLDNKPSLANIGLYLNEILKGFKIYFNALKSPKS